MNLFNKNYTNYLQRKLLIIYIRMKKNSSVGHFVRNLVNSNRFSKRRSETAINYYFCTTQIFTFQFFCDHFHMRTVQLLVNIFYQQALTRIHAETSKSNYKRHLGFIQTILSANALQKKFSSSQLPIHLLIYVRVAQKDIQMS